jgi:hypothetical protein
LREEEMRERGGGGCTKAREGGGRLHKGRG